MSQRLPPTAMAKAAAHVLGFVLALLLLAGVDALTDLVWPL